MDLPERETGPEVAWARRAWGWLKDYSNALDQRLILHPPNDDPRRRSSSL